MARTFGGVSTDRIAFPQYAATNNLVTQTWAMWTYRTGAGGSSAGRMFDKSNTFGVGTGAAILYNDEAAGRYWFEDYLWNGNGGSWYITAPSANVWHHICVTYNAGSTSNNPLIYVDGVSQSVTTNAVPSGTLGAETATLFVGNRNDNARNWAGALAEGSAWNSILTQQNITDLAAGRLASSIQAGSLVWYAPIIGVESPEPNLPSPANPGVVTGTVQSGHPPVDAQPTGNTYVAFNV